MAEVLTQSQIDALLSSFGAGTFEEKTEEEKQEKKYRKYDFYSPKKFTKDRLKILKGVYENYARVVTSRLNSILRVSSEVEVVTVEEQRYYEFSNALNDNDILTMINVQLPVQNNDNDPCILHMTSQLMLCMIDRMLGGSGEDAKDVSSSYTYTEIEISLYENIIKYIIEVMKDGWSNYLDLNFQFHRLETNPGLMQDIGVDETIVIIVLDVDLGVSKGKVNICLPGTLLSSIFTIFDQRSTSTKQMIKEEETAEEIFDSIKHSPLEIKAKLGETQILLSDVYGLHVGDVINLNKPKDSDVYLYVEDKPWFKGKLGVQNKNMAVKISEVCEKL